MKKILGTMVFSIVTLMSFAHEDVYKISGKVVEFNTGSDQLSPRGKAVLDELVPILQNNPNANFEIGGHTDDQGNDAQSSKSLLSIDNQKVAIGFCLYNQRTHVVTAFRFVTER